MSPCDPNPPLMSPIPNGWIGWKAAVRSTRARLAHRLVYNSYVAGPECKWSYVRPFGAVHLSLARHGLPLDKEHPLQPAFTERLAEHAEGKKRNQHQQHDQVASEGLLQPSAEQRAE
jgi:hypothetical protein